MTTTEPTATEAHARVMAHVDARLSEVWDRTMPRKIGRHHPEYVDPVALITAAFTANNPFPPAFEERAA